MPTTAKELIRELKRNGFITISQSGSHIKMKNPLTGIIVVVPNHNGDLKKGLEMQIRKKAGL